MIHKSASDGRGTTKGNGDRKARVKNYSEKNMRNPRHSYTFRKRY